MTFQWWRVSQRGRITLDCGYAKSGDLISDFILMHCDVEGSVWGSAENQSGVSWNRLHSVFPWYLQHQQPPGRTAEGRRLHNSVVQRGRRGQVMRVKTWGGSEFLPHQRCFGMKRKHGLLPDHISQICCFDPPWPNAIRPEARGLPDISGQPLVPSSCLKKGVFI